MGANSGYINPSADISIVVPCLNESKNIQILIDSLNVTLKHFSWEVIFVDDDSNDGTLKVLRDIARRDSRVRYLHRIGRRGLASAVVEGILSSSAPYIAVMDADLQHDEKLLPNMHEILVSGDADLVVGSRYMEGGGVGAWEVQRRRLSQFATWISNKLLGVKISDPMSGFFMVTRVAFDRSVRRLSLLGYKLLLDILASSKSSVSLKSTAGIRIKEIPYQFKSRVHGESKLDALVLWDCVTLLIDKLLGHIVPVRFIMFGFVGTLGVFVHFTILASLFKTQILNFSTAQALATCVVMTFNFFLNNILTYRDMRLSGFEQVKGLVSFYLVCSLGVVGNVGVATYFFEQQYFWWLAAGAGTVVGAVWNYAATSIFTWKNRR